MTVGRPHEHGHRGGASPDDAWHGTALDWADPVAPSPWSPGEDARFEAAALALIRQLHGALGPGFRVRYEAL